ncbi:DUF1990 family protein [Nocardia macrotermitis]|uniref:DUF1990 domain-containing protein n=1 Tax=Nocardia macrotermitis TaxID=2585198 RepID=A0A7K0CYH6_9NOCA|nr:DUF1990 domain-containing protein [Nocardia macrotermitis]MQY18513.1 hypothetical protein [Nocardia macrotermitis]
MADESDAPPFTYPETGATSREFPAGYHHFRLRRRIGAGRDLFESAAEQVLTYRMQRGAGIFGSASTPSATPGTALTVRLGIGPLAITAPCRVVYVLNEPDRRGFAYGTLPGHPEIGEELFAVDYDPTDDSVHGLVAAFSRPGTWYTRLGGPVTRRLQHYMAGKYVDAIRPA